MQLTSFDLGLLRLTAFQWVLLGFTERLDQVLLDFTRFECSNGIYIVLLGFYRFLLGFTGFY